MFRVEWRYKHNTKFSETKRDNAPDAMETFKRRIANGVVEAFVYYERDEITMACLASFRVYLDGEAFR